LSKALLNDGATSSLDQALEAEGAAQAYNFSTSDVREALAAYRPCPEPGLLVRVASAYEAVGALEAAAVAGSIHTLVPDEPVWPNPPRGSFQSMFR